MLFIGLVFTLHNRCMVAIPISLIYRFDIVIYEYITGCMLKTDVFVASFTLDHSWCTKFICQIYRCA